MPDRPARDCARATERKRHERRRCGIHIRVSSPPLLDRILARGFRPFAKVEPGEALTAGAMMLAAFLLLTAYYLLKTVREPLILLQGGAEVKLYARAAQAVLMVGVVHVYGEIAQRVGRRKLLAIVFAFFISNLVVFALLSRTSVSIGLAFFLWVGLFSYTSVAQFWALAADLYSEDQGKRLFPILGIGSSVGAVAGSRLAKSLVPYGPHALMETAALILVACVGVLAWVEWRAVARGKKEHAAVHEQPLSDEGALHLLLRDRYLLLIAGMIVLLNWCNSAGEYIFDRSLLAAVGDAQARGLTPETFVGSVKADYFAWYNGLGMLLQLFAVSRILAKLGVRNALLFLPVFAFFGYASAAFVPVLAVIQLTKIGENALEYSVAETSRHALYLVTSRVEKYVGKTSVDTISVRVGAILSASVVWIGGRLHLPIAGFAVINVALALAWIAVVVAIGREHARRKGEGELLVASEPLTS
jgi:AAA family ATP:ADP antiporter